ncbi:MAG TPA: hypothetical protein VK623_09565 [Flavobacterium sp.]|nr:hypothetical protein [Flavobacterium sp.]
MNPIGVVIGGGHCRRISNLSNFENLEAMNILQRAAAPTPCFFKKLRLLGLILTTASGVLIGGDMAAGTFFEIVKHVASAGAVLMAVSQVTVDEEALGLKLHKKSDG